MQDKPQGLKLRGEVWWIDKVITVNGKRRVIRESTRCREITDAVIVLEQRLAQLSAPAPTVLVASQGHTFAEAAAEYILDLERRGKDTTRQLYALAPILPVIEGLPLRQVHQRTLQPWIDAQAGQRASGTVSRTLQAISTILHFAAEVLMDDDGEPWLRRVPPKLSSPDWGARQPTHLTWDEQAQLVQHLPEHILFPVLFAVATGARQNEVVTLEWSQHRPVPGLPAFSVWWVPPEKRKWNAKRRASEQGGRFIVANADARQAIAAQQGKHAVWVFPSPRRDGPLYRINNHSWKTACRKIGKVMRVHDLRHTFGKRAADVGIPLDIRRSLLGHEHRDITLHYSTPGLVRLWEEAEKVKK